MICGSGKHDFGSAGDLPTGAADVCARATSRRGFLGGGTFLAGSLLAAGGVVIGLAERADSASSERDVRILNYVLRLEELKAAFYREAADGGALSGELEQLAELLARHEGEHVSFLRKWLASNAGGERTYDFGDTTRDPEAFARTARTLEETAVGGYLGQGANLTRSLMVPFAQMCSVEARHAAWINDFLGSPPAPRAADEAKAPPDVLAVIEETGFETS